MPDCITMVNEEAFNDNSSQYEHWKQDRDGYMSWLEEKIAIAKGEEKESVGRTHGFYEWGKYQEQIAAAGVENDD